MNDARNATATMAEVSGARAQAKGARAGLRFGEASLYALIAVLVLVTWKVSRLGLFTSKDDLGYWLGVAGGSMMLMLFLYPLRKHTRLLQRLGPLKYWFMFHMVLGIGGPALIMLHSTYKIGSMNAAIALTSMVVVVASGVIGRFLYRHVHRGFLGNKSSLRELQLEAGFAHDSVKSRFHFVPAVEVRLLAFEAQSLQGGSGPASHLRRVLLLPLQQKLVYLRCWREVVEAMDRIARHRGWSARDLRERKRRARALMSDYLASVVNVAQFAAYERLFALWHVLHVPFLYLLVISAIAHVIAVHVY